MNLKGRLLGNRYEIIEKIGNGGMAMVYKAKCHVLNRYVAVKILRDEFTTDEEFIKRFSAEAQSAASITHPNIVSVYDVGKEENLYYIVMELIKGKTLKEIIVEEQGALPWKWSMNIAIQIASALETAHKNNIVHRDIKPHNIIITEDGVAKVTDFGIAKAVSNSTITAFGSTMGSVHYFSPEHARGGFTDTKSDLYSLGVVMYEMLTGKVPFDADTPVSVALKHMQEDVVPPIEINPKIPKAVNDIILKAMRKDTTLRYQSATEMLVDLNRALKEPTGDFVDNLDYEEFEATKKIPTLNDQEIKKEKKSNKNDGKFAKFVKKHRRLVIAGIIAVLFVTSLLLTIIISKATKPKEVILPNLVGISKEEAENILKERNLKLKELPAEYNSEVKEGYIIEQKPIYRENYSIKEGSEIEVIVSLGIEETEVPKVVGMTEEEAIKTLEEAKLKYEIKEENNKKVEKGIIIKQDTEPEKTVYAGDTVVIYVSLGVKMVEVPSVVGKTEDAATKILEELGLKVNPEIVEANEDDGLVQKQSIEAGKEVTDGSSIKITINKVKKTYVKNFKIDLKSITGGYDSTLENLEGIATSVDISITSGEQVLWSSSEKDKNGAEQDFIEGSGKVKLKLTITDTNGKSWVREKTVDFNNTDIIEF